MIATKRQTNLITKMERALNLKFTGSTIEEATEFITKHLEAYQIHQSIAFDMIYNEKHY